jgi:hypothetical protein
VGGGDLPRYIHKLQIRPTNQLNFGGIKKTVIIFTNETGVVDGFLSECLDIGASADDADVIFSSGFVVEGDMLTDEHSDAYAGHVESIQEGLNLGIDLGSLTMFLVF